MASEEQSPLLHTLSPQPLAHPPGIRSREHSVVAHAHIPTIPKHVPGLTLYQDGAPGVRRWEGKYSPCEFSKSLNDAGCFALARGLEVPATQPGPPHWRPCCAGPQPMPLSSLLHLPFGGMSPPPALAEAVQASRRVPAGVCPQPPPPPPQQHETQAALKLRSEFLICSLAEGRLARRGFPQSGQGAHGLKSQPTLAHTRQVHRAVVTLVTAG